MKDPTAGEGTIQVLLARLNNWRLPRALALKTRVDQGGKLDEHDIVFLEAVMKDARQALALSREHPELKPLLDQLASLYNHITGKALENEQQG